MLPVLDVVLGVGVGVYVVLDVGWEWEEWGRSRAVKISL